ncbi:hypothetical protein HZA43_03400 [Candidatus Peregrinibacteria bacterium]|nr:hypothetical protein [Candidatus Peregrinibacteria bacterium]
MNSQRVRVGAWLLFLILIGALLIFLYRLSTPVSRTEPEKAIQEKTPAATGQVIPIDTRIKQDNEAFATAVKEGSDDACNQIQFDDSLKQKCLDGIHFTGIINRRNVEACDQLLDPKTRQFCIDKIYFLKGVDGLDAAVCEKIIDASLKANCLDQINVLLNANHQTLESCGQIQSGDIKSVCFDQYYYQLGIEKGVASDCSKINDPILSERCKKVVAQKSIPASAASVRPDLSPEGQLKTCQSLNEADKLKCKDEANYELAFEKKDLVYCNSITDSTLKNKCQMDQEDKINGYFLRLAIAKKDATLCQKIIREDARTTCLNYIKP